MMLKCVLFYDYYYYFLMYMYVLIIEKVNKIKLHIIILQTSFFFVVEN